MNKCKVQLNAKEEVDLINILNSSKFIRQLKKYYLGKETSPDISVLQEFLLEDVIPSYFGVAFELNNLVEFLQEDRNRSALKTAITSNFSAAVRINSDLTSTIESPDYTDNVDAFVANLKIEAVNRAANLKTSIKDKANDLKGSQELKDSSINGLVVTDTNETIWGTAFGDLNAYKIARFKNSSSMVSILFSRFLNNVFIKNVFIDTKNNKIVNQVQEANSVSEIDQNLKKHRLGILESLINKLDLYKVVKGVPTKIEYTENLGNNLNNILPIIEQKIINITYKGKQISLLDEGALSKLTDDYSRTQDPLIKEVLDDYVEFLILADFDTLLKFYVPGSLDIDLNNTDFSKHQRKYSINKINVAEAYNASWEDKVQNGVELASDIYKTIIDSTPIISYVTGEETNELLYPVAISEAFNSIFNKIDREDAVNSIKSLLLEELNRSTNSFANKDILYTVYKKFFEYSNDKLKLPKSNRNKEVASFLQTLKTNSLHDMHELMLLILKPLQEVAKVHYAEAGLINGNLQIVEASTKSRTTISLVKSTITENINKSKDAMADFFSRYDIKVVSNGYEIQDPEDPTLKYTINKISSKTNYNLDILIKLSKDLLGLDFVHSKKDKEFFNYLRLESSEQRLVNPEYLTFLYEALQIAETKQMLYTNGNKTLTFNKLKSSGFFGNYKDLTKPLIPLNTVSAQNMYGILEESQNRYTGNRLKSTVFTAEKVTVAGFSVYNYYLGFKQNLKKISDHINSVAAPKNSVFERNFIVRDPNVVDKLYVRGAASINGVVKSNKNQRSLETLVFNINIAYFSQLGKAMLDGTSPKPIFDMTVFSDKTTNFLPAINNTFTDERKNSIDLFVTKNVGNDDVAVSHTVTADLLYENNLNYYRAHGNQIADTWAKIYETAGFKDIASNIKSIDSANGKLTYINSINDDFWKNQVFDFGLTGLDAVRYYSQKAKAPIINWVHFQQNSKEINGSETLTVKPILIDQIKQLEDSRYSFDSAYEDYLIKFANNLAKMNFEFSTSTTPILSKLYPNLETHFIKGDKHNVIKNNGKEARSIKDIHPGIVKYFFDFNLVSESMMQVTLGTSYAHKGQTNSQVLIAQNKRNVAATASVRLYSLGLLEGVEDETTVAVIDDFETTLKTILSGSEKVVSFDGGSFSTYSQRVKTWKSLNSKYGNDGGIDHKSFVSAIDPYTGIFLEQKHADFALTNDLIKNSLGSDFDLYEFHKKLYVGDVSKIDITKSFGEVDLSNFKDVYYYQENLNVLNATSGTIYKVNSLVYKGLVDGISNYEVTTTDIETGKVYKVIKPIATFFDIWDTLGAYKSVSLSDTVTSLSVNTKKGLLSFTKSHTASEKIVIYEAYIGKEDEMIVKDRYISASNESYKVGYEIYKELFNIEGIVNSHIELIEAINSGKRITEADLYAYDMNPELVVLGVDVVMARVKTGYKYLNALIKSITKDGAFTVPFKKYQRFKGSNVDRISTAGAQKVGQYYLNNNSTFLKDRKKIKYAELQANLNKNALEKGVIIPKIVENIVEIFEGEWTRGEVLKQTGKVFLFGDNSNDRLVTKFIPGSTQAVIRGLINAIGIDTKKDRGTKENSYFTNEDFEQFKNQVDQAIKFAKDSNKIIVIPSNGIGTGKAQLETRAPLLFNYLKEQLNTLINGGKVDEFVMDSVNIPGVNQLIPIKMSNFNTGIQLNAWHSTENSTVTAPTQMLNGAIFRAFSLDEIYQVYEAIGDIVDKELTYVFSEDSELSGEQRNIPQLIKGLSNPALYSKYKDVILNVFKDILNNKVKGDETFTLEKVIVETFSHLELPIDDPHVFKASIAELASYFTKKGVRINFDGIFSVLTPSAKMQQFVDVRGGYIPIKTEGLGVRYKALPMDKITTLNLESWKNWNEINGFIKAGGNDQLLQSNLGVTVDLKPRELKGQQLLITYADGTTDDLTVLRKGDKHMLREAEHLQLVRGFSEPFKKDYKKSMINVTKDKIIELHNKLIKDYAKSLEGFIKNNPELLETYELFQNEAKVFYKDQKLSNKGKDTTLDFIYRLMSKDYNFRDVAKTKFTNKKLQDLLSFEFIDIINSVNKVFLGKLQNTLNDIQEGKQPQYLIDIATSNNKSIANISVTRAEVVAPITAKKAFLLREGDNFDDIDELFFLERLNDKLKIYEVEADRAIIIDNSQRIFFNSGNPPKNANKVKLTKINGVFWFMTSSGNALFEVPNGATLVLKNGELHVYYNNPSVAEKFINNVNRQLEGKIENITLGNEEARLNAFESAKALNISKATKMFNSWRKYLEIVGTRIPGQHYQSFQGMKIVGFTEGNKVYVPDEITLLSGSDFDIDKQNMIYHSVDNNGLIAMWHPMASHNTIQELNLSLKLPLPSNKSIDKFVAEKTPRGRNLGRVINTISDNEEPDLVKLLEIYDLLKQGFKFDYAINPNIVELLLSYENYKQPSSSLYLKSVKNFSISKLNSAIENVNNYTLLSNPISMSTISDYANVSIKAKDQAEALRQLPTTVTDQKTANMVGKDTIGIVASSGLKSFSALTLFHNQKLKQQGEAYYSFITYLDEFKEMYTEANELGLLEKAEKELYKVFNKSERIDSTILSSLLINVKDSPEKAELLKIKSILLDLSFQIEEIPGLPRKGTDGYFYKIGSIANLNLTNTEFGKMMLSKYYQSKTLTNYNFSTEILKLVNFGETDVASMLSELLSAATDNAKELILDKLNANPELMGIYLINLMYGGSFEETFFQLTDDITESMLKNATSNIYDPITSKNSINKFVTSIKGITTLQDNKTLKINDKKLKVLQDQYKFTTSAADIETKVNTDGTSSTVVYFTDTNTGKRYPDYEITKFKEAFELSDELTLLAKYLGINQGVKSSDWELYDFTISLENFAKRNAVSDFTMKKFLDSVANNDEYHTTVNFGHLNIPQVLIANPHFIKQLTAYNVANTILNLSSYKVKTAYDITEKLKQMHFIPQTRSLTKDQYKEVASFIDSTVLSNFIEQEEIQSKYVLFFDKSGNTIRINTDEERTKFVNWVNEEFRLHLKDHVLLPELQGNDFIDALITNDKFDYNLNDKFKFMQLEMDTTNVKSATQSGYRDSYLYNLKLIHDKNLKDKLNKDESKRNDIFQVLFWYNLIVNKNNISKNSYAKFLGEIMIVDNMPNIYKRLLKFVGNVGKNEIDTSFKGFQVISNGIEYDVLNMLAFSQFGEAVFVNDNKGYQDDDPEDYGFFADDEEDFDNQDNTELEEYEVDTTYDEQEFIDDADLDDIEGLDPNPYIMIVEKYRKKKGESATGYKIYNKYLKTGNTEIIKTGTIKTASSILSDGSTTRTKLTTLNKFTDVETEDEFNHSLNYLRMLNLSIHELLTKMGNNVNIEIIQYDSNNKEIISKFDPSETYKCL